MATLPNSAVGTREHPDSLPLQTQDDSVLRHMLVSALNDNAATTVEVIIKALFGMALIMGGALLLPLQPGLMFYAAVSAALPMIYIANLADVHRARDVISFVVPTLFVWGVQIYDVRNEALLGLTLFSHVFLAFFVGFARTSGSVRDLGLWPALFGAELVMLVMYIDQFLI